MTTLKKNFWSCHVGTQVRTEAHEHPFFGRSCVNIPYLVYRTLKRVVLSLGHYGMPLYYIFSLSLTFIYI